MRLCILLSNSQCPADTSNPTSSNVQEGSSLSALHVSSYRVITRSASKEVGKLCQPNMLPEGYCFIHPIALPTRLLTPQHLILRLIDTCTLLIVQTSSLPPANPFVSHPTGSWSGKRTYLPYTKMRDGAHKVEMFCPSTSLTMGFVPRK